jgi:hypothetical protein
MKTAKITTLLGITAATVGSISTATPAFGVTLATLNGTLADADAIANVTFIAPSMPVNFKTTSYSTGNFSPVLTLFDSSDNYFNEYIDSGDLDFNLTLTPGTYRAVISAFGRFFDSPTNTNFSAGFSGTGDFGLNDSSPGSRGADYALTISTIATTTTAVPEPSSIIGTALAGFGVVLFRRKLSARSRKLK